MARVWNIEEVKQMLEEEGKKQGMTRMRLLDKLLIYARKNRFSEIPISLICYIMQIDLEVNII